MEESSKQDIDKFKKMQISNMCSKWSPKEEWIDNKCPACGQILLLPD